MNHDKNNGFTLIELMLAMTFIAMLLLAIALTTMQIGNIYNKGITLREVNQAGRSVSDDLQRSIAATTPFTVTPKIGSPSDDPTSKYVVRTGGGRLCIGSYSYVWNLGSALAGSLGSVYNKYTDGSAVRFAKVLDPSASLCADPTLAIKRSDATEMLASGDRDLVAQSFAIKQGASDPVSGQALYAISMAIGTNDQSQLLTDGTACKPPADIAGAESYCAVNQFDIIARAGNTIGGN